MLSSTLEDHAGESEVLASILTFVQDSFTPQQEKKLKQKGTLSAQYDLGPSDVESTLLKIINKSTDICGLDVKVCSVAGRRCIEVKLDENMKKNYEYFHKDQFASSSKVQKGSSRKAQKGTTKKKPQSSRSIHKPMGQSRPVMPLPSLTSHAVQSSPVLTETPAPRTKLVGGSHTKGAAVLWTQSSAEACTPRVLSGASTTAAIAARAKDIQTPSSLGHSSPTLWGSVLSAGAKSSAPKAAQAPMRSSDALKRFSLFSEEDIAAVREVTLRSHAECSRALEKSHGIVRSAIECLTETTAVKQEAVSPHGLKRARGDGALSAVAELRYLRSPAQSIGLRNVGNTCFMNAVMQMICSLREFVAELVALRLELPEGSTCPITKCTMDVVKHMDDSSTVRGALDTNELRACIARVSAKFGDGMQHDAHEFFLEYVNQLHAELTLAAASMGAVGSERQRAMQSHLHSQVLKQITCTECHAHHSFRELFSDFSLDLEGSGECVLDTMLGSYFSDELVNVKCEKCGASTGTMDKSLVAPPQVLVLHLKRFLLNPLSRSYNKQHKRIKFEASLDLRKNACKPREPRAPTTVSDMSQDSVQEIITAEGIEPLWYDLRSIVTHDGWTPHSGHYAAYARSESGSWRLFDDTSVKEVSPKVEECLGQEAYMLVYKRRSTAA